MSAFVYDEARYEGEHFTSRSIDAVYFDREDNRVGVEFISSSTVYVYDNVTESMFNLFVEADSLNDFYRNHISRVGVNAQRYDDAKQRAAAPSGNDHSDENAWEVTSNDDAIFQPTPSLDDLIEQANNTAKYGVKWVGSFNSSDERMGPFEFVTEANSIDEALVIFNDTATRLHGDAVSAKIVSVTRYFD